MDVNTSGTLGNITSGIIKEDLNRCPHGQIVTSNCPSMLIYPKEVFNKMLSYHKDVFNKWKHLVIQVYTIK